MPTTTLTIVGMQSDDCLRTVMNAIQDLPCIGYVDISTATGEATIEHTSWPIHNLQGERLSFYYQAGRWRCVTSISQRESPRGCLID